MKYRYSGYGRDGKPVEGTTDAADPASAREALRRDGVIVLGLGESAANASASPDRAAPARRRVATGRRLRRIAMFARQLHVLLRSGTPILQALNALARQADGEDWRRVLESAHRQVEEGRPLSDALRSHPEYFDEVTLSLVAAGEASGDMPRMFERVASLTNKQLQLRGALTGALAYPCVLIGIGVAVMAVMLLFVLPRFEDLFTQIDGALPLITRFMLGTSHLVREQWWLVAGAALALAALAWTIARSRVARAQAEALALRLPRVGRLASDLATAQLARMLGTLLECKVPLLDALDLTRRSLTSRRYADVVSRAHDAVTRGESVSSVLGRTDLISPCVQEALVHGETSGQIGGPLTQMADFLDEENDQTLKALTRLIEPAMLVVLGVAVGGIAMSMFLPLFDLVSSANGGH